MKSLKEFIKEYQERKLQESADTTTITLNFAGLENAEETLKSLEDKEGCTVEDETLTISISKDNVDKFDTVQDILQQYVETLRGSTKRSSDEQYAQKIKSFADKVANFNEALDKIANPEEE